MTSPTLRLLFSGLCAAGFAAILVGLLFEIGRMKRATSVLPPRQARWRVFSGILWLLVLGSLEYANFKLWPFGIKDRALAASLAARYVSVVGGALMLLMVALFITAFDVYLTLKGAQLQRQKFESEAGEVARAEIERIRAAHGYTDDGRASEDKT